MRRKPLLAVLLLLVLMSYASAPAVFAYPIAYCNEICGTLYPSGTCRSPCTEMLTNCGSWWATCGS